MEFCGKFKSIVGSMLLLVMVTSAWSGVSDYSFRIKGLGASALDFTNDAYSDVFYNPAYIDKIDGIQIYTNLSNLGGISPVSMLSSEVSMIQNAVYPTNLIGFLGRWKFLSGGAFYSTEGYDVNFEGSTSNNELDQYTDGFLTDTWTRTSDYSSTDHFSLGGRQLIAVGSINLFGLRLGLMGKYRNFSASLEHSSDEKVITNDNGLIQSETSNHKSDLGINSQFLGLTFGTLIGGDETELSVSAGIEPGGASFQNSFFYDWIIEPYYQSDGGVNYANSGNVSSERDDQMNEISVLGTELFAKGRLTATLGGNTRTSLYGKLSETYYPISLTDESEYEDIREKPNYTYEGSSDQYYGFQNLLRRSSIQNGEGALNILMLETGFGFEHSFDNGSLLILGIKGKYARISGDLDIEPRVRTEIYQELRNDPEMEDYGYERTIYYNNSTKMEGSGNILFLELPSAIEFGFLEAWKFRVGSDQMIPIWGKGDYKVDQSDESNRVVTKYTHGPNAGITEESDNSYTNESNRVSELQISTTNLNMSSYHTGLGYEVNENITMDILHYTNLTNLSTWYLSFSMKF